MVTINWNSDQEIEVIDAIRYAIGRDTDWYVVASSIACPTCYLDVVTDTSTDPFCPTCSGTYWIPVYSGVTISGHITWGFSEKLGWESGGQLDLGDCRVQVKYTVANLSAIDNAKYAIVDGRKLIKKKVILRGVKNINRILVDLIESEKE